MTDNKKKLPKQRDVPKFGADVIAALQSNDPLVRANAITTIYETRLPALKTDTVIPKRDAGYVRDAVFAVFTGKGGVPAYQNWAEENETEFYRQFTSLGKELEKLPATATQIIINSALDASPLDAKTSKVYTIVESDDFTEPYKDESFE